MSALFHLITGLRRGEALGMHWDDVDLDTGHVVVAWQVINTAHQPTIGQPKTSAGARVVPIDPGTAIVLRRHRDRQHTERTAWGQAWTDTRLVFTREDGTTLRPDYASHLFTDLVQASGLPRIRLHDLRHTHVIPAVARQAADAIASAVPLRPTATEPGVNEPWTRTMIGPDERSPPQA